jgi:hypothetical protein
VFCFERSTGFYGQKPRKSRRITEFLDFGRPSAAQCARTGSSEVNELRERHISTLLTRVETKICRNTKPTLRRQLAKELSANERGNIKDNYRHLKPFTDYFVYPLASHFNRIQPLLYRCARQKESNDAHQLESMEAVTDEQYRNVPEFILQIRWTLAAPTDSNS